MRFDNFKCTDPPLCQEIVYVNDLNANFKNCIFTGNEKDEISLIDWTDGEDPSLFNYSMTNCAVKVDEILNNNQHPDFFDYCTNCIRLNNNDTIFIDLENQDFHLDTMSIMIDKGLFISQLNTDLEENPRDNNPDIGCYEFQK